MERDTVKIMDKKFLKCWQQDCEWNIGWLGGHDWTAEPSSGVRICNLGARAMIEAKAVPPYDCQQSYLVLELAYAELDF